MPRVVDNQRAKFETDAVLKQLQDDCEIRYTNHWECSLDEKRLRFPTECHEGSFKIGFPCNGVNLQLSLPKIPGTRHTSSQFADFTRENGKVYLTCPLIFNGVCVRFCGYLDLHSLAGIGRLEFDETLAEVEHRIMVETVTKRKSNLASQGT